MTYTDLTKYHEVGLRPFVEVLDGQEWVFTTIIMDVSSNEDLFVAGFGEPENIEDFPELLEFDKKYVSYWFRDIDEAIGSIGHELFYGFVLIGFGGSK